MNDRLNYTKIQFNEQSSSKILSGIKLENGITFILTSILSTLRRVSFIYAVVNDWKVVESLSLSHFGDTTPPTSIIKKGATIP